MNLKRVEHFIENLKLHIYLFFQYESWLKFLNQALYV